MLVAIDDTAIITRARAFGFELVSSTVDGHLVWGWRQDGDDRRPRFETRTRALDYIQDRLRQLQPGVAYP
jgi:hypothetical protein